MTSYQKGSNVQLSDHFNSNELDCKCPQCTTTQIDPALITALEAIRAKTGPLIITSGYRCQHHQDELRASGAETATGISQHTIGRAADVTTADSRLSGVEIETIARSVGIRAVGVAKSWAHIDLRDDKDRRWTYND